MFFRVIDFLQIHTVVLVVAASHYIPHVLVVLCMCWDEREKKRVSTFTAMFVCLKSTQPANPITPQKLTEKNNNPTVQQQKLNK